MSTFLSSNPTISSGYATEMEIANLTAMVANIDTLFVSNLTSITNSNITNIVANYGNIETLLSNSITSNYANINTMIANTSVMFGQVYVFGNVISPFFIGNGALLTSVTSTLPPVANIDIRGNVIGGYANVSNIIAVQGYIGNVQILGGNVSVSGQVSVLGNVVAPFFIGNGATFSNVVSGYLSGQNVLANLITFGPNANVAKLTGVYYVALNGNDATADGSEVKPFLTIQAAHDRALTEYPPNPSGAISKQVQIIISPGVYTGSTIISRYNTILLGAGSLTGRGQMTSIGQVTVNCSNAAYVFNNSVGLSGVFISNGLINSGTGSYTLNMDSCYVTSSSNTLLSLLNPNSLTYVNNSYISASVVNVTYVNAIGGSLSLTDCTIQNSGSGINNGYLINVGGNCTLSVDRCYLNPVSTSNAVIYLETNTVPVGGTPF